MKTTTTPFRRLAPREKSAFKGYTCPDCGAAWTTARVVDAIQFTRGKSLFLMCECGRYEGFTLGRRPHLTILR